MFEDKDNNMNEQTGMNNENAGQNGQVYDSTENGTVQDGRVYDSAANEAVQQEDIFAESDVEIPHDTTYRMTFDKEDQPGQSFQNQQSRYQGGQTYNSQTGNQQYNSQTGGQQYNSRGVQQDQPRYDSETGRPLYDENGQYQGGQQYSQTGQQTQYQTGGQQYSYSTGDGNTGGRGRRSKNKPVRQKHKRPYIKAVGCAVLCGVIIGACVIGSFAIGKNIGGTESNPVSVTTNEERLAESNSSGSGTVENTSATGEYTVAQIAENCGTSVVAITNKSVSEVQTMFGVFQQESEGSGSGVIVAESDSELLIVTNNHVVEDAEELTVCFNDSADAVYSAVIKGTDANNDLAVVAIPLSDIDEEVLNSISIAVIGDSDSLKVGDGVVAVGNALGLGQSVTSGIISAVDREVTIDSITSNLIQTDAAINPGNSGGALFNMQGELIGINSAKYASEEVEGMGFAIPMSTAEPIIENLMNRETRTKLTENYGCLNITGTDVTSDVASAYNMPQGVYVSEVLEGAAADNAGMKAGDIITALDGISVSTITALKDDLQYYKAGETVDVVVYRNNGDGYEEMTLSVKLDNASQQDSSAFSGSTGSSDSSDQSQGDDSNGYYYYYYGDDGSGSDSGSNYGYYFGR